MDKRDAQLLLRAVKELKSSNLELAKAINRQTDAMLEIERLKRENEILKEGE